MEPPLAQKRGIDQKNSETKLQGPDITEEISGLHDIWDILEQSMETPVAKIRVTATGINDRLPYPGMPVLARVPEQGASSDPSAGKQPQGHYGGNEHSSISNGAKN